MCQIRQNGSLEAKFTASSANTGTCKAVGSLHVLNAIVLLVSIATKTGADEPERLCFREETTASAGITNDEATSVPVHSQ